MKYTCVLLLEKKELWIIDWQQQPKVMKIVVFS